MAEFVLRVPGEPERIVPLRDKPVVVGRAEECDVQVAERKASKRHLRFVPVGQPGGGRTWTVEDLESSNGTQVEDVRVVRRALVSGDRVRVGDTTLEFRDETPAAPATPTGTVAPAIQLSGALSLVSAPVAPAVPVAAEMGPSVGEDTADGGDDGDDGESTADALRAALAGRRALARGATLAVLASLVLAGVLVFGGGIRDEREKSREEVEAYAALLAERDRPSEILDRRLADFESRFPASRLRPDLEHVVAARRAEDAARAGLEQELESLTRNTAGRSESEIVGRLRSLESRAEKDSALARRIALAREDASRRLHASTQKEWGVVEAEVDKSLARGDAAAALRRISAFEASHPALPPAEAEPLDARRASVRAATTKLADGALAQAQAQTDPDARRAVLLGALRGLEDTPEAERISAALHQVTGGTLPTADATPAGAPPGTGPAPTVPEGPTPAAPPDALVQATEAERLGRERKWAAAVDVYRRVLATELPPRLRAEWTERVADLARVAALVDDLQTFAAAAGEHPAHVKLEAGTFELLAVDPARARLRRGDKETTVPWADAAVPDLLALLSTPKATPDRHLALAILAADLGQRSEAVAHLLPLVQEPTHRDDAFRVMARRLEGRARVPEGGYQALDGELLDRTEFAKRTEAKHVAALEAEAAQLVAKVAAEPVFKGIEKVRARRDELDRRRAYALLAIFNEKQWPYPHNAPELQTAYAAVTQEVEKRWKSVEEVWNEPLAVKLSKAGPWEKLVERHVAVVRELEARGRDATSIRAAMAPYALWVGEPVVTVRTFVRNQEERDLLAYDRWVIDVYNVKNPNAATEPEREEIRITNEYRMMMGWQFRVDSGPTPVEKIDNANVIAALDQAREAGRTPLHALRIDDRLVTSARGHSVDMQRRGFFAHEAPPNPATGEGATMPWDRMGKAGYKGGSMSENITQGRASPLDAHLSWLHSSGHHRNILSDWADQGVGQSGGLWTQNFGNGGGAPQEIPGKAPAPQTPPEDGSGSDGSGK